MKLKRIFLLGTLLAGLFFNAACNKDDVVVSEENEKSFRRAKEYYNEGRVDEAIKEFASVIKKRGEAPESHFDLGLIYMTKYNNSIMAIYHFQKSIEEGSSNKQRIEGMIEEAKRRLAEQLKSEMLPVDAERSRYLATIEKYNKENQALKQTIAQLNQELAQARTQRPQTAVVQNTTARAANTAQVNTGTGTQVNRTNTTPSASTGSKTYTVEQGDTLSKISRKFYNTPNRWQEILDANKDKLPSARSLKPGQVIVIP